MKIVTGNITPKEFGIRLKELRGLRGISQQNLADSLGVSKSTIHKMENGKNYTLPDREQIMKIEEILNTAHGTLLGFNDFIFDRYTKEEQELLKEEGSVPFVKEALAKMKLYFQQKD